MGCRHFIDCQHRNTLINTQVPTLFTSYPKYLNFTSFLYLYQKNLHAHTVGGGRGKGEKGNCGRNKEISDMQRGYITRNKRKERKYDKSLEPY